MSVLDLPTPLVFNAVPSSDWPLGLFIFLYLDFSYNGLLVLFNSLSDGSFFIFNVVIMGNRFRTITDILKLLNYDGPRNRPWDQKILTDCCLLHAEVLEYVKIKLIANCSFLYLFCVFRKTKVLIKYFNVYGLCNLLFPLFIDSMLLFNLFERGFDLMSIIVYFAFFCIFASITCLSQVLTGYVS